MHKMMEDEFFANPDVVFLHIQTVFEGAHTNTFENGIYDLDDYQLKGIYGFDPRKPGQPSATMQMFNTGGTPYTVIIGKTGQVLMSDFTPMAPAVRTTIQNAVAVP